MQRDLGAVVFEFVVGREQDHLRLEYDPAVLIYRAADVLHQLMHVVGRGPADIHDKARVLFGNLRPADSIALEAEFLTEPFH